jgi:hypothetical protein
MLMWEKKANHECAIPCNLPNLCWTPREFTKPDMCWPATFDPDNIPAQIAMPQDHFIIILVLLFFASLLAGIFIGGFGVKAIKFCRMCNFRRHSPTLRRYASSFGQSFRRSIRHLRRPPPPSNLPNVTVRQAGIQQQPIGDYLGK